MMFFHPDGHALFLLALCIIGPLLTLGLIALITSASDLRRRAELDAQRSGLSWSAEPEAAQFEGSLDRAGQIEQSSGAAAAQLDTANDVHPRHLSAGV
ncbi:MAG: hypothetical protein M0Z51_05595 [Propionibacterium sp.]|nr:hypothetical protein [Propionibacterium sp.]